MCCRSASTSAMSQRLGALRWADGTEGGGLIGPSTSTPPPCELIATAGEGGDRDHFYPCVRSPVSVGLRCKGICGEGARVGTDKELDRPPSELLVKGTTMGAQNWNETVLGAE